MATLRSRTVRGYASFLQSHLAVHDLTLDINNAPIEGHANIINWPEEPYQQLGIVSQLADTSFSDIINFDPTISPEPLPN